jgi:hypothetical protein
MHISLDSALGRQRRLNSVGESVFQIAPDAAAGYSLRSLTGGDPAVVRVRRESDNNERDFNASGVSSGELVNWVNEQITPPLDLRELTATGRDGPIIEAAAAYSLRNLSDSYTGDVVEVRRNTDGALKDFKASEVTDGTLEAWVNTSFANALPLDTASGAAAAYSLRNLSSSYTGSVVDVRRSSDGNTESFTATEVTDGTLLAWVGLENEIVQSENFSSNSWNKSSNRVSITSDLITAPDGEVTADLATWSTPNFSDALSQNKTITAGTYTASIYLKYNGSQWVQMFFGSQGFGGGHGNFDLLNGVQGSSLGSSSIEDVGDGWYRCSLTRTASINASTGLCATISVSSGTASRFGSGIAGSYYVWGAQLNKSSTAQTYARTASGISGDGTVSKWYDQSGNDNHATQGTPASQPKIVDGGSLVTGGLDFDGVADFLEVNMTGINAATALSTFNVITPAAAAAVNSVTMSAWSMGKVTVQRGLSLASSTGALSNEKIVVIFDDGTGGRLGSSQYSRASNERSLLSSFNLNSGTSLFAQGSSVLLDLPSGMTTSTPSSPNDAGYVTDDIVFLGALRGDIAIGLTAQKVQEMIFYPSDQSDKRRAIEENIGNTYGITLPSSKDGTVSKWYDQSTTSGVPNAKHAVQTSAASQPKIVSGGSLVLRGNKPSINFFNDALESPVVISQQTMSVFTYAQPAADGDTGIELRNRCLLASGTSFSLAGPNSSGQWGFRYSGVVTFPYSTSNILSMNLHTFLGGANGANYFSSGSNVYTDTVVRSNASLNGFTIGRKPHITAHSTRGYISEMIIYNTDQTDNRTALEANIGEVYGIAGIPAYEDTVNGFVETWYDQSGNGNDATQLTAGSQPKIVDAGVFLGQVDFLDGVSTFLGTNNSNLANLSELSLFSVLEPVIASANEFAISAGSIVNSTGNYGGWALWANGYSDRLDFTTQAKGSGTNTRALGNITSTSPVVYSATLNGTNAQAAVNGVLRPENTSMITPYNGDATRRKLRLGCQYTFTPASFYRGAMKEIILYASDQTANRAAIEANINNQYDIYS